MWIFFNFTKDVDASANETYLIQNKSPASCAYTSNVIPINSIGYMNKTSRIRFFDTSTWYLEQRRHYYHFLMKIMIFLIIANAFLFFVSCLLFLFFFFPIPVTGWSMCWDCGWGDPVCGQWGRWLRVLLWSCQTWLVLLNFPTQAAKWIFLTQDCYSVRLRKTNFHLSVCINSIWKYLWMICTTSLPLAHTFIHFACCVNVEEHALWNRSYLWIIASFQPLNIIAILSCIVFSC